MSDCVFCKIARREAPAVALHEDAELLAFLDLTPVRRGHAQIIPKRHVEAFDTLPPELAAAMVLLGQRLARRMKAVYAVDRVAFLFTGGDVPHAHAHVIPMHEKTDVTSARYLADADRLRFTACHLRTDLQSLEAVKAELAFHVDGA
jgi:histidine triad (HIT) family protein